MVDSSSSSSSSSSVAAAAPASELPTPATETDPNDRATAEAGAVRGLAQSVRAIGGRAVRFPSMGRLPAPAPRMPMPKVSVPKMPKVSVPSRVPKISAPRVPNKISAPRMTPRPKLPSSASPRIPTTSTTTIPVKQVAKISDRVSTGWGVWDSAHETEAWTFSRLRPFVLCKWVSCMLVYVCVCVGLPCTSSPFGMDHSTTKRPADKLCFLRK
jgi:hypothetical protein